MDNKKIRNIILAVVVFIVAFISIRYINQPQTTSGDKSIHLIVIDNQKETILDKSYQTDAKLLGDLIDELQEQKELDFKMEGERNVGFGRYISGINDLDQTNSEFKGYAWVYESDTSESCSEMCPGIDDTPLNNNDTFTFKFTNEFN